MKYSLLFIFSFTSILLGAQDIDSTTAFSVDTSQVAIDTPLEEEPPTDPLMADPHYKKFQPSIYLDYGKLITYGTGIERKLEGAASLLAYDHFEVIGEYGQATLEPKHAYANGNYKSEGTYWRVGGGYLTDIDAKSSIGLGVRYGQSKFDDGGLIEIVSPTGIQADFNLPYRRTNLTARWWSMVLTSESRLILNKKQQDAKINYLFRAGFFFRMRFLVAYDNQTTPVEVYSIPGYGQANNKQQAVLNLFLKITP